jgi:hypothetical protein
VAGNNPTRLCDAEYRNKRNKHFVLESFFEPLYGMLTQGAACQLSIRSLSPKEPNSLVPANRGAHARKNCFHFIHHMPVILFLSLQASVALIATFSIK